LDFRGAVRGSIAGAPNRAGLGIGFRADRTCAISGPTLRFGLLGREYPLHRRRLQCPRLHRGATQIDGVLSCSAARFVGAAGARGHRAWRDGAASPPRGIARGGLTIPAPRAIRGVPAKALRPPMIARDAAEQILRRFETLEARLAQGRADAGAWTDLSREYADLRPTADLARVWIDLLEERVDTEALRADRDMAALAAEDLARIDAALPVAELALKRALLPKDAADPRPAIVEFRAGTGGEEAALFAGDLMRMYQRYAESRGWRMDVLEMSATELGGIREAMTRIEGQGVFGRLKYESGVHRVQRVPTTESGGRIHTSAATVAVLPEAEERDLVIDPADIRIDTMRASGAGGQHVNTTDSAVRITHLPTGIIVTSSEKSQHRNRAQAMMVLRARLLDIDRQASADARAADRKGQVGSGDRSERIRTYNFPQGRVSDHRINLTLYRLAEVMAGDLDDIIDALASADEAARLVALEP
jgi:peptide chain release factor 1